MADRERDPDGSGDSPAALPSVDPHGITAIHHADALVVASERSDQGAVHAVLLELAREGDVGSYAHAYLASRCVTLCRELAAQRGVPVRQVLIDYFV